MKIGATIMAERLRVGAFAFTIGKRARLVHRHLLQKCITTSKVSTFKELAAHVSPAGRVAARIWTALAMAVLCLFGLCPGRAVALELVNGGMRVRVGDNTVLGKKQPEVFREYDLFANLQLPWQHPYTPTWGWSLRLLTSIGVMQGEDQTGLVASGVPLLVFGSNDGRFSIDAGAGLAVLSRHRFALQDYGGPVQAALSFAVSLPLYRQVGIGYRYLHYSDASLYGHDTIGADFHMVELLYRF